MPSSKTWPGDDVPDYIVRSDAALKRLDAHAMGDSPFAAVALHRLADHYTALAAMMGLKAILDNYVDGVIP